jgi:hypothetical protein
MKFQPYFSVKPGANTDLILRRDSSSITLSHSTPRAPENATSMLRGRKLAKNVMQKALIIPSSVEMYAPKPILASKVSSDLE